MNKWEKEVQASLLESEEETLKELQKEYAKALAEIKQKIQLFQSDIDLIDQALEGTMDETAKAFLLSQKRSKIYQQQFQEALQGQINGILDKMHSDNYSTIEGYLKTSYEDAFLGNMYDLANQGVPVIVPINQAAATKAILTDSKISTSLYDALGVDVGKLKKTIAQTVSRGIASSLPYSDIANQISRATSAPLSRAMTIARTEGGRIQQQATEDHTQEAIAHGADLVKIWDSTLDSKTRESHRKVDGEVREQDEPFSNGLMYPKEPNGSAAEVINCRCVRINKPRWALDDGFSKMDGFSGEIVHFDSQEDYQEFKEKYWSKENQAYMEYVSKMESKYQTKDFRKMLDSLSYNEYQQFHTLETSTRMLKPIERKVESGIINVEIDDLTPCLRRLSDGKLIETTIVSVNPTKKEFKDWEFDWTIPKKNGMEIRGIKAEGDERIQGLIALKPDPRNIAVKVDIVEAAPFNNPHNKNYISKEYEGVGGHLFAEAVRESYKQGFGGYVYFTAKSDLVDYYHKELGAILVNPRERIMAIEEGAAKQLYERYYSNK